MDINITILYFYYFHYKLLQHSCHQHPLHGYHQHLQQDASEVLLKYLQRKKNTCFFYLLRLNFHAPLAPSNLTKVKRCHHHCYKQYYLQ